MVLKVLFKAILILICLISISFEENSDNIVRTRRQSHSYEFQTLLPDCNQEKNIFHSSQKELLIISTLDGKLSALDVDSEGDLIWSNQISSEPLLSSTISNFELTKKGQIVRIVPSLDGNLYLYNGKTIDGIPLNVETLLKSSYKLGDDLVISGGQETRISGLNILTGDVYYECGVKGCPSSQANENETFDDLFLVKRITQTVRAIEPRNGKEKWYFSVSEPQLSMTPPLQCHDDYDSTNYYDQNVINDSPEAKEIDFKVIVPNGIISVKQTFKSGDTTKSNQWQYQFESPIVHVWHYRNRNLIPLNLFDKEKLFGFSNLDLNNNILKPSIYIGRFQQQWYVQSSNQIKSQVSEKETHNDILSSSSGPKSEMLQIEWKPQAIIFDETKDFDSESGLELVDSPQFSLSSSLNDESLGYYILEVGDENDTKCFGNESGEQLDIDWDYDKYDEENGIIQQIVITSLWYYWKEVTAISIAFAISLNCFLSYLKRKFRLNCNEMDCDEKTSTKISTPVIPSESQTPSTPSFSTPFSCGDSNLYISRYFQDFEPIQVLGKGGFGVVFESKHIIDESHYAVKRICLPFKKEQRDKVMREVKALSKLDHTGIVRYYNAWVEVPPPGWQEDRDKLFVDQDLSQTNFKDSHQSKQIVNQTLASHYKIDSIKAISMTKFSANNENFKITTQTFQTESLDIVFDDNISSIKLIESDYRLGQINDSGIDGNNGFCRKTNGMESNSQDLKETKFSDNKNKPMRPNGFPCPPPRCYLYIQMQLCRKDTLKDWLFNNACNRDRDVVLDIFNQIVSAVHYVHSMGLMHRDLKPSNIFFSMDGTVKIGDFGLVTATAVDDEGRTPDVEDSEEWNSSFNSSKTHTNKVGTQLYMSPEQVENSSYSDKVDIFSMGIILFELLVPFKTQMERHSLLKNARKRVFPNDFHKTFLIECNLLRRLLSHNPEDRPSTSEMREHELLKDFQSNTDNLVIKERRRTISQTNSDTQ